MSEHEEFKFTFEKKYIRAPVYIMQSPDWKWMVEPGQFDYAHLCCFCGEDNRDDPKGYAGERCCHHCGKGGDGEPDEPNMAYKNYRL
jgi:hypothetical protein